MDLPFQIDQKSGIPIYIQIMDQIKHLIATGSLETGDQLPTIREMAVHLTINLHTVAHAYAELEREEVLTVKRGRGTFVANGQHLENIESVRQKKLQSLIDSLFVEAMNLGYEQKEVKEALETYLD
jgi:GntR family transcriptional regulator